jgi:hypothetical protein
MRVLVIGYPLPDAAIDNYSALNSPSYADYDAVVVDPASITRDVRQVIEEGAEYSAHDSRPVRNAPSTAATVSIADQLRRRLDETRRLLEFGGTVIVFGRPNAIEGGVAGFEGCDRYHWLPAPSGLTWGTPYLRAAEGRTVRIVAEDHPLAGVLRQFRNEVAYRATFDDRQSELRAAGRVLVHGGSGVPTAMEFPLLGGRVLFMPAFSDSIGPIRGEIATAMVDMCKQLGGSAVAELPPYWTRSLALPGLEQAEAELETATAAVADARARLTAAQEQHDTIESHRRLLWATGRQFEQAVAEALRLIGFGVNGGYGDESLSVVSEGKEALVESESSPGEVVEWPYVRLQRRLEERLLQKGEQLKGIVIANGHRGTPPENRAEQFTTPLRVACENYRYSLLSADTLFAAVQRVLAGADDSTLLSIRRRIMTTAGLISTDRLFETGEAPKDAGPIF